MQQKKSVNILISIFALGFIIWFGGSIVRSATAFDIFTPGRELELRPGYTDEIRMHSVYNYSMMSSYTDIAYGAAFVSALLLIILMRKQLKQRGWLLMAFVLFFISAPIEAVLIYYDIQLGLAIHWDNLKDFNDPMVSDYFLSRFRNTALSVPSALAFLASLTALLYIIWRPLDKTKIIEDKQHEE